MKKKLLCFRKMRISTLHILILSVFIGSIICCRLPVQAATPFLEYGNEAIYKVGNSYRDKQGNYLLGRGGTATFTATQSVYSQVSAIDWQINKPGVISFVGGKPSSLNPTCTVRGVGAGTAVLDGKVLSSYSAGYIYDVQWCSNPFPIRVVKPLSKMKLAQTQVSLSLNESKKLFFTSMVPDSLYSLFVTEISYSSSNPSVVKVDSSGKMQATGAGTATVSVNSDKTVLAKCKITVKKSSSSKNSSTLSLNKTSLTMTVGSKVNLTAKYNGKTIIPAYSYTSGNKKIALISKKGVITAKQSGTVKIKASYKGKSKICTIKVVPKDVSLKASVKGKNITLKWNKASNITGYKIYRSVSSQKGFKEIKALKVPNQSMTLKNQKSGTYYFKICSYKIVNGKTYNSPMSKVAKIYVK